MSALSSLTAEESELISQIQHLSERLETIQKVIKALSKLAQGEKALVEMRV